MLVASDFWIHPSSGYLLRVFFALLALFGHLQMRSDTLYRRTHVMHECCAELIMRKTD